MKNDYLEYAELSPCTAPFLFFAFVSHTPFQLLMTTNN